MMLEIKIPFNFHVYVIYFNNLQLYLDEIDNVEFKKTTFNS